MGGAKRIIKKKSNTIDLLTDQPIQAFQRVNNTGSSFCVLYTNAGGTQKRGKNHERALYRGLHASSR